MRDPDDTVHLDLNKPLFDTRGNPHVVVLSTQFQLLTLFRGLLFVWDKQSGESLMRAGGDYRLANDPLPKRASSERVTAEDRLAMAASTMVIDCLKRSSRAAMVARDRAARPADSPKP